MKKENLSLLRNSLFEEACSHAIPEVVNFMLDTNLVDINDDDTFLMSFMASVSSGDEDIVRVLLHKRDLLKNKVSENDLCYYANFAYCKGMFEIAKELINYGYANLMFKIENVTLLYRVVKDGNVDFVDFLLQNKNIDILQGASDGTTPISVALFANKDVEMAFKLLKAREISYYKGLPQGFSCAVAAFCLGAKELSSFILTIPDIKIPDDMPFALAIDENFELLAEVLKLPQTNVNATSYRFAYGSLLSYVITKNRHDIVDIMLNHEKININQECAYMPLATAVEMGNKEMVEKLLRCCDVDVNAYGWRQEPPIITAIKYPEILKMLLANSQINPKETNSKGNTALIEAVSANMYESVDLLLKNKNVNINASTQDFSGLIEPQTELHKKSSIMRCRVIFKVGPYASIGDCANAGITALHIAIAKGYDDIALRLLKFKRAKCSLKMPNGTTLLQWAIYNGMYNVVEKLISRQDVSVNEIPDALPLSPLMLCVRKGEFDIFKLLLNQDDIDINAQNKFGNTILTEVYKGIHIYGTKYHYNFLALLLKRPELDLYAQDGVVSAGLGCEQKENTVINAIIDDALSHKTSVLKLLNKYRPEDVQKIIATKTTEERKRLNDILSK